MVSKSFSESTDNMAIKRRARYSSYSDGYDPKAVEYDLITIRQLMRGKKKLTMQLAQEIYYKIKRDSIRFRSDAGEDFLTKLFQNMTETQIQEIDKAVLAKKRRSHQKKQLLRINRAVIIGMFTVQLILCVVFLNWNLILDFRTNYETSKLQAKIGSESTNTRGTSQSAQGIEQDEQTALREVGQGAQTTIVGSGQTAAGVVQGEQTLQVVLGDNGQKIITDDIIETTTPDILDKFTVLYNENPDFAGWLKIDGTKIDYPVMSRAGDNNYYLDKNFTHQKDKNGLLILDYRSDVLAEKQNIIIYGHNMRTGVMFGTLKQYKDKSFCEAHPTIHFDSLYEECEYQVVAALLSEVAYEDEDVFRYYDAIDISTEESFHIFKENIYQNAIYTIGEELQYGDSCLVLSTCDNYKEDGRFVVVARKKKYL